MLEMRGLAQLSAAGKVGMFWLCHPTQERSREDLPSSLLVGVEASPDLQPRIPRKYLDFKIKARLTSSSAI
jgi:hypothetical protein